MRRLLTAQGPILLFVIFCQSFSALGQEAQTARFEWQDQDDATGYVVEAKFLETQSATIGKEAHFVFSNLVAGATYQFSVRAVSAAGILSAPAITNYTLPGPLWPVVILQQPKAQSILPGDPIRLTVETAGTAPVFFQWLKDGIELPGATNDLLFIPAATTSDPGLYRVRVSNAGATNDSDSVTVDFIIPPEIQIQPTDQIVQPGSQLNLTVLATGGA